MSYHHKTAIKLTISISDLISLRLVYILMSNKTLVFGIYSIKSANLLCSLCLPRITLNPFSSHLFCNDSLSLPPHNPVSHQFTASYFLISFPLLCVRSIPLTADCTETKRPLLVSVSPPVFFICIWAHTDRLSVSLILAFKPLKENKVALPFSSERFVTCYHLSNLSTLLPSPLCTLFYRPALSPSSFFLVFCLCLDSHEPFFWH